jgi:hypothetical protein
MTVDLNTCVPGQQCVAKDGKYFIYLTKLDGPRTYPHLLLDLDSDSEESFTNYGLYDIRIPNAKHNIVRIIPMESTKSDKHPSVAWWESCPWITDRTPTEEDGNSMNQVLVHLSRQQEPKGILGFMSWETVRSDEAWIHCMNWQPPVLSNKEQALELLNKHEGGWCPTPKEWTIIRKGLEE